METRQVTEEIYKYIAPHILGNELLKKFLALQMFVNPIEGEKFHLLVIGGTSVGKTEICQFEKKILPRSIFIQKDTTPVGLREILTLNPMILFCDEFDKMKRETRGVLLESMQSQTITTTKHNDYEVREAKVNVTALCNPIRSELNKEVPLTSQLSFSKEYFLLSRFHIILPVFAPNSNLYGDIAEMMEDRRYNEEDILKRLKEVIYKTKLNFPQVFVNKDLARRVGEYVSYLKNMYPNNILITTRLIEGILSAMKARTRMRQSNESNQEDLEYIKDLYRQLPW